MSKYRELLLFLFMLSAGNLVPKSSAVGIRLSEVLDFINVTKDVVAAITITWNLVDQHTDFSEIPIPIINKLESKLFEKIGIISAKMDKLGIEVDAVGATTIAMVLQEVTDRTLRFELNDLMGYITRMDVNYRHFQNFVKDQDAFDFADHIVSHDNSSITDLVKRIHAFIAPNNRGTTVTGIQSLKKYLEEAEGGMLCDSHQSPQQVLFNLYNTIALTELKGYTMIQFSYMLLRLHGKGNFTKKAQLMKSRYEKGTNDAIKIVRKSMKNASRDLWNCDPEKHKKGETYEEITQLLQGYVVNEVDLNPKGMCEEGCAYYTYTKQQNCDNSLCRQQRNCKGNILNCQFLDSDMQICPANPLSGRRYNRIEYGVNGQACTNLDTDKHTWLSSLSRKWQCSYCFCLCDDKNGYNSDRTFNKRPAFANMNNNSVMTGLRFVKKNRIIHLQIQEGKLLPRGKIDVNTVRWVPVEDYKITDRKIYDSQDFHTLSWSKRNMHLDDLEADDGYILTGVRFKEIGTYLNFEIYVTKFDFDSGKLINPFSTSTWKDNINTDRTEVILNHPDIPILSPEKSIPTSKSNQYIKFVNSDNYRDVAQTTVPFLDSQKVESLQAVPLSGAGIFHKGRINFGGFITPKIITYDFSKHLKTVFPEEVN